MTPLQSLPVFRVPRLLLQIRNPQSAFAPALNPTLPISPKTPSNTLGPNRPPSLATRPSCIKTPAPSLNPAFSRSTTSPASDRTPSNPLTVHPANAIPIASNTGCTAAFRNPAGARNHRHSYPPVASLTASWHRSISFRTRPFDIAQNHPAGCVIVWFPTSCPRRKISRTSSGWRATFSPITKNVAFAPAASSKSNNTGVSTGSGPSSIVNHTARPPTGKPLT